MTQYLDRFIPNRTNIHLESFGVKAINELYDFQLDDEIEAFVNPIFLNTAIKAKYLLNYRIMISDVLNIKQSHMIISNQKTSKRFMHKTPWPDRSWPVNARKQPLLQKPQAVLDMPFITLVDPKICQLIDWGRNGQIATIFCNEVHLWSSTNEEVAHTNTGKTVSECLKWNKTGSRLAVSRYLANISIIDGATLKIHETVMCPCRTCNVSAFEWTRNDYIIAGCTTGSISVISRTDIMYARRIANDWIIDLKLSCNETYLMVSTKKNYLHIFKWPMELNGDGKPVLTIQDRNVRQCAAWHPWKNTILAIGNVESNKISIWNIDARKCIDYGIVEPFFKRTSACILDFLTFCPMSGELVICFFFKNREDVDTDREGCSFLTVFSDLHTRVDEVRYHVGRVPYALWNKHGTKLATLGTDENLVIWDFFGKETQARMQATKKTRKLSGIFDSQSQFRSALR